ncbi:MAG: hypothetical protein CSYNP_02151 [Syntrophus sp. SKADARSKE-3]|nr:hypothetical protein [Syntrophus sp. SKADARSKE-3]
MKRLHGLSFFILVISFVFPFCTFISFAHTSEHDEITRAIRQKQARWSADRTAVARLSSSERKARLRSMRPERTDKERTHVIPGTLPDKLDWRNYNSGSYVTPVKEQGVCSACWAFAPTAALESSVLISQNTPGANLDLSEQALISCGLSGSCAGGLVDSAADFIRSFGLPLESCYSYGSTDGLCGNACADWAAGVYKINDWYKVPPTVDAIKFSLYNNGPLVVILAAQTDFFYYKSGIYSHSWGTFEGYHAAVIIGYDDAEQYFVIKSSWGADWGEAGYARIAYSEMTSETKFGFWTIAYDTVFPSGFPTVNGVMRNSEIAVSGDKKATVSGTVRDKSGKAVGGAAVSVGRYSTTTDAAGNYTLPFSALVNSVILMIESGNDVVTKNLSLAEGKKLTEDIVIDPSTPKEKILAGASINGLIDGLDQMSVGGSQTLSVHVYISGETYTWTIVKGGGFLSASTGASVVYTAPMTNPDCANNPTIVLSAGSKIYDVLRIALNGYQSPEAVSQKVDYNPITYPCWMIKDIAMCNPRAQMFNCAGDQVYNNYYSYSCNPCSCGGCIEAAVKFWNVPPEGLTSFRTPVQKAAGCCPKQLMDEGLPLQTNDLGSSCLSNLPAESSVNLKSGNLYFSQDAGKLTLSYNSVDTYGGPIGSKWTHNHNLRIIAADNSSFILKNEDGNIITFRLSSGTAFYKAEAISGDTSQITKNANGNYVRTLQNGIIQNFNASGFLTSVTDRNGNSTILTYNGSNLSAITDPSGRITTVTSTGDLITALTDAAGRTYTLGYMNGFLTSVTDPLGNAWQYTYDANGRMLTKTYPAGRAVTYTYDVAGRLFTSTDPDGKSRTLNYGQSGLTTLMEKDGSLSTYTYDPIFTVKTARTDALGNTTQYTYDAMRNLIVVTAPDGSTTRYTYDGNGNILSTTNAQGNVTMYTYNSINLVASVTDPNGNLTSFTYDGKGNLTAVTDATNAIIRFRYDSKGNVIAVTDPLNKATNMTYDASSNLIFVTYPRGGTVTMGYGYDVMGNMTSRMDPLGNQTFFQYNALNQLITVTDPKGKITRYTYDYQGNRLSTLDANGNSTDYVYNYRGQLTQITDALSNITRLTYGPMGCSSGCGSVEKLSSLTDALNRATLYAYDSAGRLIQQSEPLSKVTSYGYDRRNNVSTMTTADGKTIRYSYDLANRLTQKTFSDGTSAVFQYDGAGNMTYAGNQNIAYTFVYDANSRITGVTDSNGVTITYQYDAAGNRTTMTTPGNKTTTYTYDQNNFPIQVAMDQGQYGFTYDSASRRSTRTMPNGITTSYSYNQNSNITGITTQKSGTTLDGVTYTLDNVGNRITKSLGNTTWTYGYDATYRVRQATPTCGSGKAESYTYDAVGNRLSAGGLPPNNEVTTNYTYDDENGLTQVVMARGDKTKTLAFTYDPLGRRISKTIVSDQIGTDCTAPNICPRTTNYIYDNRNIILEYDQANNVTARYTYGPNIDEPLAMEKNGQMYYYHSDGLGSITAISDAQGNIFQQYAYDTFGNITTQTGNIQQPYAFTGREYDKETGMYFYRARYYDPMVGRLVTKDPIGFAGGDVNLYNYVRNNPVMRVDPWGNAWMVIRPLDIEGYSIQLLVHFIILLFDMTIILSLATILTL